MSLTLRPFPTVALPPRSACGHPWAQGWVTHSRVPEGKASSSLPHAQNSPGTRQVPGTCPPSEWHKEGPWPRSPNEASQQGGAGVGSLWSQGGSHLPAFKWLQVRLGGLESTQCLSRARAGGPDPSALDAPWVSIKARLAGAQPRLPHSCDSYRLGDSAAPVSDLDSDLWEFLPCTRVHAHTHIHTLCTLTCTRTRVHTRTPTHVHLHTCMSRLGSQGPLPLLIARHGPGLGHDPREPALAALSCQGDLA